VWTFNTVNNNVSGNGNLENIVKQMNCRTASLFVRQLQFCDTRDGLRTYLISARVQARST
jgi:hypothetical protein